MCRVIWHRLLLEAMVIEGWTWLVHHYSTSTDTRQDRSSDQKTLSSTWGWRSAGQVPIVFPCLVPPIPQCPVSSFQEWRPFRSFAAAASPSRCDVRSELAQLLLGSWTCCSSLIVPSIKVFPPQVPLRFSRMCCAQKSQEINIFRDPQTSLSPLGCTQIVEILFVDRSRVKRGSSTLLLSIMMEGRNADRTRNATSEDAEDRGTRLARMLKIDINVPTRLR